MADEVRNTTAVKPKSSTVLKPILIVGIGCFVVLFVIGTAGGFLAKGIGISLFQSLIEKNLGVKTNLGEIEKGKLSLTDKTTDTKLEVGTGKLPDNFPKDFPLYPGVKVTGSLSGAETGKQNGFWITFTTADSSDKVASWYKINLKSSGWETESALETGHNTTWSVAKGTLAGTVTVSGFQDKKETTVAVTLSEGQPQTPMETQAPSVTSSPSPADESTNQGVM